MYSKHLTPAERLECIKFGAVIACINRGKDMDDVDAIVKSAAWYDVPSTAVKTVLAFSLVTGVPIGIAAHAMGSYITRAREKERELMEQKRYYESAVSGLSGGLQADSKTQM